jgi:hypothetical protein
MPRKVTVWKPDETGRLSIAGHIRPPQGRIAYRHSRGIPARATPSGYIPWNSRDLAERNNRRG